MIHKKYFNFIVKRRLHVAALVEKIWTYFSSQQLLRTLIQKKSHTLAAFMPSSFRLE
ncbi:MAG: hypothetical protein ACI8RD_010567 [Bacillariaceae sp.]|jgi:hypothetical protein